LRCFLQRERVDDGNSSATLTDDSDDGGDGDAGMTIASHSFADTAACAPDAKTTVAELDWSNLDGGGQFFQSYDTAVDDIDRPGTDMDLDLPSSHSPMGHPTLDGAGVAAAEDSAVSASTSMIAYSTQTSPVASTISSMAPSSAAGAPSPGSTMGSTGTGMDTDNRSSASTGELAKKISEILGSAALLNVEVIRLRQENAELQQKLLASRAESKAQIQELQQELAAKAQQLTAERATVQNLRLQFSGSKQVRDSEMQTDIKALKPALIVTGDQGAP